MVSALKFENVTKRYGKSAVLDDVSFEVPRGTIVGLAGINGAGKTTLIKCMLGLCGMDSGGIEIFGISHSDAMARSALAYLPEKFNPPAHLKGSDFLRLAKRLYAAHPDEREIAVMLSEFGLDHALDLPVGRYSKGMAQKLGLAACFLSGKDLFVLDEPMSGLDPRARAHVKEKLLGLRDGGGTLLFTSHALSTMGEICDRVAVLHEGRMAFLSGRDDVERAFLECTRVANSGSGANV